MFKIDLKTIRNFSGKTENYEFKNEINPMETEAGPLFFKGPVLVDVNVTNLKGSFVVKGHTEGLVIMKCSRCLDEILLPFHSEIDQTYRPVFSTASDDVDRYDNDDNDIYDIITFRGNFLDITPEVLKSIYMSLPMKVLCTADCKGLCQHCGTNLNKEKCNCEIEKVDPRLAVLKGLLKD
ncbi:YceD family protein [Desulfolucanica intricata]|uniref:YceD family protein n=1 Tax=Desulfolucanica intricata TaxID=1285191 RepID=UPI0008309AFC|nr:DUF177 domain-containing protein [Desulfolucanica intricata]